MTPRRRRWLWIAAGVTLVAVLSGGRWLAVETAERAWASSIAGGDVYLQARQLARALRALILLVAVLWSVGNLFVVYRAIGSVQMPRRLGDLEIVEAVPHSVLMATTAAAGVVIGLLLTWGTGNWWLAAALAKAPPHFGLEDPVLHHDAGYYVATLPWFAMLQNRVLATTVVVMAVVVLLYYGIGSLRRVDGEWRASPHARGHLGVLLAIVAVVLAWGAWLDPAEVVAGLHGPVDRAMLDFRVAGAPIVAGVAIATALASLAWAAFGRSTLLLGSWAVFGAGALLVYALLPGMGRGARGAAGSRVAALETARPAWSDAAFGPRGAVEDPPPAPRVLEAAAAAIPLWDARHVAAVARRRAAGGSTATVREPQVALAGASDWLAPLVPDHSAQQALRPAPDWTAVHRGIWARTGPPLHAIETDTGLAITAAPAVEPALWFGAGFNQFAVAPAESAVAARVSGIPLRGAWRRAALAWALQSPELARDVTDGLHLLWRRDPVERLSRLAPFAVFEQARPAMLDGRLFWVSYGYVRSASFPLVAQAEWGGMRVRYLRAGLVGTVSAATGETRLYAAPASDSLTAAWAAVFAPLVAPQDSMPRALRARLAMPRGTFALAAERWLRDHGDTTAWAKRPAAPYELLAPSGHHDGAPPALWTGQAFVSGAPSRFTALLAGMMTPNGPHLLLWRPAAPMPLPAPVAASSDIAAGAERLWVVADTPVAVQAQFDDPQDAAPALRRAWIAWGERVGEGANARLALRNLLAAADREAPSAEVWDEARRILAQADSALLAGDLQRFGRLYAALKQKLLAPPSRPR